MGHEEDMETGLILGLLKVKHFWRVGGDVAGWLNMEIAGFHIYIYIVSWGRRR